MFNQLARFGMSVVAAVVASTALGLAETSATPSTTTVAQTSPAPAATATPKAFNYRGYVRAYNFTRQNASNLPGGIGQLNQSTFNLGLNLHGDYNFGNGFKVNAAYFYANPLSGYCANTSDYVAGSACRKTSAALGTSPHLAPDVTLPPYIMSTLYEANLQYKGNNWLVTAGDQVINTPWANASDSRLKPNAFQGIDANYAVNKNWSLEGMYMDRWESRIQDGFNQQTLVTGFNLDDGNSPNPQIYYPGGVGINNNGFAMGKLGYVSNDKAFTANGYYYSFDQIANMWWLDGKYTWAKTTLKPFVAAQFGAEQNQGTAIAGKINSSVFGLQGGVTLSPNVTFTLGYDNIPSKVDTLNVSGSGIACNSKDKLSVPAGTSLNYFVGQSGTPQCTTVDATHINVYYGGWASPYTDSYATDPLFTTSISQGMADRRAFGQSIKAGLGFVSNDKRFVGSLTRAWYVYGNATVGVSPTQETNLDGMYYFSPVPKSGPYKGFLLRHRYAERTQQFTEFYGGTPLFKYNRTQLEYDF